ncbi:PREDICTED: uncharacterized protein LOC104808672 [Tarenaya hassleriana]|uniref:uncharacterized protein LOC104808672 n=1 Tax=Tarenaya hassleriana TaxID=28532 RepID=UPI00053C0934|nr:PREDICTED: uncharacterized protein LOC104808672 [Tarenaya hassleriana]
MEARDQRKNHSPGSEGQSVHVCNKCGWQYPNPHPSAKHRRAHKKICGSIKGYELFDSENADPVPGFDDENSPKLVEAKIGGIGAISNRSELDEFEDAVCEFSGSPSGREDQFTMDVEKIDKSPDFINNEYEAGSDEIRQSKSSPTVSEMRKSGVSDSGESPPSAEVLEIRDPVLSSDETALSDQRDHKSSAEESNTKICRSQVDQVIGENGNGSEFSEGNLRDGSPSESDLASLVGKGGDDASGTMWNDDVIYSEVEGPDELVLENSAIVDSTEDECTGIENILVGTPEHGHAITADKDDNVMISDHDDIPFVENAETTKEEEYETDTVELAECSGIQSEQLNIEKEVPFTDVLLLENKNGRQDQDSVLVEEELPVKEHEDLVVSKIENSEGIKEQDDSVLVEEELPVKEHEDLVVSKIENSEGNQPEEPMIVSEDIKIEARDLEATESPSDTEPIIGSGHTANIIHTVASHESELIQANDDEAGDSNIKMINEGNDISSQRIGSSETCKDNDAEVCVRNNEAQTESDRGISEENIHVEITNTREDDDISHSRSTMAASDAVKTYDLKSPGSKRTDFYKVLGGLGVIQGNEIESNDKTREDFAEVPVAVESNDHRGFGRLKNLSEAHIRSLVPSLVATKTTSDASDTHVSELKKGGMKASIDGPCVKDAGKRYAFVPTEVESETRKPEENRSQPTLSDAAVLSEIMENQQQQQHVPLKNLLSEARSPPQPEVAAAMDNKNINGSDSIPRVSSILGPESPPESCFPAKGEVSEEWKTPARYPAADVKREERKTKSRPFWVPFVCCSSVN